LELQWSVEEVETLAEALQRNLPAGAGLVVETGCSIAGQDLDLDATKSAAENADIILLALVKIER